MLKLWKSAASHEDLFIERYERLLGWSLNLTAHDRQLAEDLLHDVFVQFTLRRPDLNPIQDLDGYLFTMLRNSHVSYVRRAPFVRTTPLSMAEYDSLEIGLRATDVRDQIKVQDELRLICRYAALRKNTSKAGSVLILRFFHGYYPSEIAQILKSRLDTVRKWLQLARNEAKLYLESPDALSFIRETTQICKTQGGFVRATEELLRDLREIIFSSREGDCFSRKELCQLYVSADPETVEGHTLAHIVSCARDLDEVNALLNLPLLNQRYPTDMTGNDRGSGGGPGGPVSLGGGSRGRSPIRRSLRRAKETFEHYPRELRIAVNGHVHVSQKISSNLMEQTVSLGLEEKIGFIEVFSEQWVRLFFLNVEPPPDGAFEQQAHIDFSEGRSLKASLDFTGPCPNLQVVYHDPTLAPEPVEDSVQPEVGLEPLQSPTSKGKTPIGHSPSFVGRVKMIAVGLKHRAKNFGRSTLNIRDFSRPGFVTAVVALLLMVAAIFVFRHSSVPPSASELLAQAVTAEEAIADRSDQVLHRTINFEEKHSDGSTVARRRIEVWHSAERGLTARRIYDAQNRLMAGDWRRANGFQTLYQHGSHPQLRLRNLQSVIRNFDDAWQQDLTARDFSVLAKSEGTLRVEKIPTGYLLTYQRTGGSGTDGLQSAELILSRSDLHPTEQTLVVRQGTEERTYHYLETSFERRPINAVAPAVFEPEPVLTEADAGTRRRSGDVENIPTSPSHPVAVSPATASSASSALEMEVVRLLDHVDAFGGDQVSVTRTPEGVLLVEGVLDTDQRKRELLNALAPVSRNPAVSLRIDTQAEAVARIAKHAQSMPSQITPDQVQVETNMPPAYSELRRYFSARSASAEQSEREISLYRDNVLALSMRARQHARALKQLAGRFSQEELRMLDDESLAKWRAMILQHAHSFQREADGLRRKLEQVFPAAAGGEGVTEITNDAELVKAIENLFAFWANVDENVRESLSIGSSSGADVAVKRPQFWYSLRSAETLADRIQNLH
jgi:RNA polymerase sigma factor (sigma-70 family)